MLLRLDTLKKQDSSYFYKIMDNQQNDHSILKYIIKRYVKGQRTPLWWNCKSRIWLLGKGNKRSAMHVYFQMQNVRRHNRI